MTGGALHLEVGQDDVESRDAPALEELVAARERAGEMPRRTKDRFEQGPYLGIVVDDRDPRGSSDGLARHGWFSLDYRSGRWAPRWYLELCP